MSCPKAPAASLSDSLKELHVVTRSTRMYLAPTGGGHRNLTLPTMGWVLEFTGLTVSCLRDSPCNGDSTAQRH